VGGKKLETRQKTEKNLAYTAKLSSRYRTEEARLEWIKEIEEITSWFKGKTNSSHARRLKLKSGKKIKKAIYEGERFRYVIAKETDTKLKERVKSELIDAIGTRKSKSKMARRFMREIVSYLMR